MRPQEASKINQYLAEVKGKNPQIKIYIDNLHFPYFEFDQDYILPSSSTVHGLDCDTSMEFLENISPLIPELISHAYILPEPRPKKEIGNIFLVRELESLEDQKFLWILSLYATYLGGANKDRILQPATQGRTARIKTNRIYFSSKVIPVETILRERDEIRGFDPYEIKELIADISFGRSGDSRIKPYSELFDEADYSSQETILHKIYSIDDTTWNLGNIYKPIGVEYLSISFRFLESDFLSISNLWHSIRESFWSSGKQFKITDPDSLNQATHNSKSLDRNVEELSPFNKYLLQFSTETSISPSGNMRWEIQKKIFPE